MSNPIKTSGQQTITVVAGTMYAIERPGTSFYVVDANSSLAVYIKTDQTSEELYTVGTGKYLRRHAGI